jgi:hypothetical protein
MMAEEVSWLLLIRRASQGEQLEGFNEGGFDEWERLEYCQRRLKEILVCKLVKS